MRSFSKAVPSVIIKLLLLAPIAALLSACSNKDDDTLVVGMELNYPPFETTDEDNNPSGISVDIAKALATHLNRPIRIENIPFDGLISSLKTGKIDLILSSMTATEQRAQSIDFSDPYLKTGLCLLVSMGADIKGIQDLDKPGIKVAVKNGTTGRIYADQSIKTAQVVILDKETEAVLEVSQGKVDAFIYDQMSTYKNWSMRQDSTRAILKPFKEESWAVGIKKGDNTLRLQVNEFLKAYKAKGGFEALGDRYLAEQKAAFKELGFPFYF